MGGPTIRAAHISARATSVRPLYVAAGSDGAGTGSPFRVDMNKMMDDRVNRRSPRTRPRVVVGV
jgi:hypothetical protein